MLCAIGDLVEDVIVLLSGPPRYGADVEARVSRHRGGSAANVATAAARLAGSARFVGQVGDDPLGDRLLTQLVQAGVDPAVVRGGRTGTIVALVSPDGERTMLSDRGAATALSDADPAWLDGVTVLHVPAYSLVGGPLAETTRALVTAAHHRSIPVTLDTSSLTVLDDLGGPVPARERLGELRPAVTFANAAEAERLDLQVPLQRDGLLVVKRGREATVVVDTDGRRDEVDVPAAEVIDTTGAGDAFAAGFLTAWSGGAPVVTAVQSAHEAAARVLASPGADIPGGPAT